LFVYKGSEEQWMKKNLNIVIPMKAPIRSKQRLTGVLTLSQRESLATMLFRETLDFFVHYYPTVNRLVVTESDQIARIASAYGASVLMEDESKGLNRAIDSATQWSLSNGYLHQMVVPADISSLDVTEIDQVLDGVLKKNQVVIALAKDSGTNALLTSPPDVIEFCYGKQSGLAHAQQAHSKALAVEVLHLAKLSQDIDVPNDLSKISSHYQSVLSTKGVLL